MYFPVKPATTAFSSTTGGVMGSAILRTGCTEQKDVAEHEQTDVQRVSRLVRLLHSKRPPGDHSNRRG